MDRRKISEINSLDLVVEIGNACHTRNQINPEKLIPKELVRLNEEGRMGCPTCLSPDYLRNGCLYNRYCGNCGQALKREVEE